MSKESSWPKVAVVGAGAVGSYFGGMMARAGVPVVLIGRAAFVEAVNKSGLFMDTLHFQETVKATAATQISAAAGAELVLFCVKSTDTEIASRELAKHIGPATIVVSLQNGVNNAEEIKKASGLDALPSVVYVAALMPAPGHLKHLGRGDLVVGPANPRTEKFAAFCESAKVPCRISENVEGELWTKLVWNCALNAASGLGRATYGDIAANADARQMVRTTVEEVLAVARAKNISLPGLEGPQTGFDGAMQIAAQMSAMRSSTAQDMARSKKTEIDSLNGYVARIGAELGIPTPVNQALLSLVKLLEAGY